MSKAFNLYSVSELCKIFDVSLSTYYYKPVQPSPEDLSLEAALKESFENSKQTYGKRRLHVELNNKGFKVGINKVKSRMKKLGIVAVRPKKKHYYPDSGDECVYAPNKLKRDFNPKSIGTHWVGDITYIRTHQGWCYLACVLDLGSKEVVGYATSKHPDSDLTIKALSNALKNTEINPNNLLFHSDQGCQYSSKKFRNFLSNIGIAQSMSRRGNCWDNAVMERFFRNLKTEYLKRTIIINIKSASRLVDDYMRFYNFKRLNSAIGYLTPYQKSMELKLQKVA